LQRAEPVFLNLLRQLDAQQPPQPQQPPPQPSSASLRALSPAQVAELEAIALPYRSPFAQPLLLQPIINNGSGASAEFPLPTATIASRLARTGGGAAAEAGPTHQDGWDAAWFDDGAYALAYRAQPPRAAVGVWYREDATSESKLQAMWHACMLRHEAVSGERASSSQAGGGAHVSASECASRHALAAAAWPAVLAALREVGWDTQTVYFDGEGGYLATT